MCTNTHPHIPLDHQRSRRHPLPRERANRSPIHLAHLPSILQQNKFLLADHLLAHLASPLLLKSLAQSLSKFILLLTNDGYGPNQLVSAAYIHETFG